MFSTIPSNQEKRAHVIHHFAGNFCLGGSDVSISRSPGLQQRHSEQYRSPRQGVLEHIHNVAELARCTRNILCQHQQYCQCGCRYYECIWVGSFHLMASWATSIGYYSRAPSSLHCCISSTAQERLIAYLCQNRNIFNQQRSKLRYQTACYAELHNIV